MYILDKNRDYYDYVGSIYGVDKAITYDRRGSIVLTEQNLLEWIAFGDYSYRGEEFFFILEVGMIQYLFQVQVTYKKSEFLTIPVPSSGQYKLLKVFQDFKHYYEKEITLVPVKRAWDYSVWKLFRNSEKKEIEDYSELEVNLDRQISNPILKSTSLPSFIPAEEVWVNLLNYISSLYNDKTITIVNSDVDKLVNHGFDKKTSFRHPVKFSTGDEI